MTTRSRGNLPVALIVADSKTLWTLSPDYNLLVYTALTIFVLLIVYAATKDWKGYTSPEEVDLGVVRVPSHTCRRKFGHFRRY